MMNKVLAGLIAASVFLGGCQYFMPVTADEVLDRPPSSRGEGRFSGGVCRYDNGEVRLPSSPGSSTCP